jgi:hypothetical protein
MTQTSVASVWEPELTAHSLPGGLPWSSPDETPISFDAAKILSTADDTGQPFVGETWLCQPRERLAGRWIVPSAPEFQDRIFRLERVPGGIALAVIERATDADPSVLFPMITETQNRLKVSADTLLDLLGLKKRTFYNHRRAHSLPGRADLGPRVRVLWWITEQDVEAARILVEVQRGALKAMLDEARFADVRSLFSRVRVQLAGVATPDPSETIASHIESLRRMAAEPAFGFAARAIEAFTQRSGTYAADRMIASVELESALRKARDGDDLDERWEFLPLLRFDAMDALRARAQTYIESAEFTPADWGAFVAAEAAHAWDAYSPFVLPAEPVEPAPSLEIGERRFSLGSFAEQKSR